MHFASLFNNLAKAFIIFYCVLGAYFITVKQVFENLAINKAKLLLKQGTDFEDLPADAGQKCERCKLEMTNELLETLHSLEALEKRIDKETMMSLVYIAGYVFRNLTLKDDELSQTTTFYYQKYGSFQADIDRGGLQVPTDMACQWACFCFVMFGNVKDLVCRRSLSDLFMTVSNTYDFHFTRRKAETLSNVFLNNHCKLTTPRSRKETSQKVLKLSEI